MKKSRKELLTAGGLCLLNHTSGVHALPELLLVLPLHTVPDSLEYVFNSSFGGEVWLGTVLVDTSLDEDRIPVGVLGVLVELIGTSDVGLGCIANKVDSVDTLVDTMGVLAPPLEKASSELKCPNLGLTKGGGLQLLASDSLVHGLKRDTEGTHADACKVVRCTPYDIIVREEDGWALVEGLRPGSNTAVLRHEQVEDNLLIGRPIPGVGKHEDGFDIDLREVASSRVLVLLLSQCTEGSCILVVLDDVRALRRP